MGEHKREICRAGLHPMSGPNLVINNQGARFCLECARKRWKNRDRRNRNKPKITRQEIKLKSDAQLDEAALKWIEEKDNDNRNKPADESRFYSQRHEFFERYVRSIPSSSARFSTEGSDV